LHGRDCAHPASDEGSGGAREQIRRPAGCTGTGIKNHQPQHRAGLTWQVYQPAGLYQVSPAVCANEGEYSFVASRIEISVPDEMHHMPLPREQHVLQIRPFAEAAQ